MKKIGIIGKTGRMGSLLALEIKNSSVFYLGEDFELKEIFIKSDYVVDFSSPTITKEVLKLALENPKPLALCTTGYDQAQVKDILNALSQKCPVVIAPNTSIGANIQKYLAKKISKILSDDFDIDIIEKHHRFKKDCPSGTAIMLKEQITIDKNVNILSIRSGNIAGEHEISFTSLDEMISVKHVAFNRNIFAKGTMKILDWFDKKRPSPGLYFMDDVLCLKNF